MSLPVIPAGTPTTITPDPTPQVYDHYWLKNLSIQAGDPAKKVRVLAILHKARTLQDGSTELSPTDNDVIINMPDLFAAAAAMTTAGDPSLGNAMGAVILGLIGYATAQHIVL